MGRAGKVLRLVRVMRILRVFKVIFWAKKSFYPLLDLQLQLVRHFTGLQSLLSTLQQAYQELGLLMLLLTVTVITISRLTKHFLFSILKEKLIWKMFSKYVFTIT